MIQWPAMSGSAQSRSCNQSKPASPESPCLSTFHGASRLKPWAVFGRPSDWNCRNGSCPGLKDSPPRTLEKIISGDRRCKQVGEHRLRPTAGGFCLPANLTLTPSLSHPLRRRDSAASPMGEGGHPWKTAHVRHIATQSPSGLQFGNDRSRDNDSRRQGRQNADLSQLVQILERRGVANIFRHRPVK